MECRYHMPLILSFEFCRRSDRAPYEQRQRQLKDNLPDPELANRRVTRRRTYGDSHYRGLAHEPGATSVYAKTDVERYGKTEKQRNTESHCEIESSRAEKLTTDDKSQSSPYQNVSRPKCDPSPRPGEPLRIVGPKRGSRSRHFSETLRRQKLALRQ